MGFFDGTENEVLPLITHDGSSYQVNPDAVAYLETITTPIATVSVVGLYRTGKSTLLNTLCDTDGAFAQGDTVNACTKGIRIRKAPLHASDSLTVFLLDSEGLGSLSASGPDHDTRILSLTLLLSSSLLYNSVGAIDDASLAQLGLMTRISKSIRIDAEKEATECELAAFFPKFTWVLRDFSLKLESTDGTCCSEQEYLESALADAEGTEDRNKIRKAIRDAFSSRCMVTLPRPAEHTQKMTRRSMSNAFLNGVKDLRKRVLSDIHTLKAGEHPMTGGMFAQVCSSFVDAINRPGSMPCIQDSFSMLAEIQARDAAAQVFREAQEEMRTLAKAGGSPAQLDAACSDLVRQSLAAFAQRLMHPDPGRGDVLREDLEREMKHHVDECRAGFDKKIEESMLVLERAASHKDAKLGDIAPLVQQALRQLEIDLGDDPRGLDRWRMRCLELLVNEWLPRLVHACDTEYELGVLEVEQLKTRCTEAERMLQDAIAEATRETERMKRDADLHLESNTSSLQMQLEAREADLKAERQRCEELEQTLTSLRVEIAALTVRVAKREGEAEDGEEACRDDDDEDRRERMAEEDAAVEQHEAGAPPHDRQRIIELETENRSHADELRELRALRETLTTQCGKEREQRETLELVFQQRLRALQAKQEDTMQRLRREHDEAVKRAREEAAAATEREHGYRRDLAAAQQVATRADASKEREIRVSQEAQLTLRAMCEDLQVRMMEMQRTSLEDTRRREQEHREKLSSLATEHLQAQLERGEAQRREERALDESRDLKRKLASSGDAQRDAKKMREDVEEHRARLTQVSTENEKLRVRLEEAVGERERLRTAHIDAESRRAALARELELVRIEGKLG